jgi:DNA methylase
VQVAAEDEAGLTYVNSVTITRPFGLYSTRRFVHGHATLSILTRGPLNSSLRTFHRPAEMPRGRTGHIYATDVWTDIPEERRPGLLRYDNALSVPLVSRVIRAVTDEGDLVADPFLGSGTTAVACVLSVAVLVGLLIGRVVRHRDRQVPHDEQGGDQQGGLSSRGRPRGGGGGAPPHSGGSPTTPERRAPRRAR